MVEITDATIDYAALTESVRSNLAGAVVLFLGTVREITGDRRTASLDYEAYPEMAEKKMAEIGAEIRDKFGAERVAIFHRTGVLKIGEASVGIAIATPHRGPAFEACQYAIDRLKQIVPIWKKEVWSGGDQWIGWEGQAPADLAAPKA